MEDHQFGFNCEENITDVIDSLDNVSYLVKDLTPYTKYNISTSVINNAGVSRGSGFTVAATEVVGEFTQSQILVIMQRLR